MRESQAFLIDFHCLIRSVISSPRFRSSRPSRMLMFLWIGAPVDTGRPRVHSAVMNGQ